MRATIPVLCALPFLAGCPANWAPSAADRPELARVPAVLTETCLAPVEIPERDLSTPETARLWGADRRALGDCRRRHGALAASVTAMEGQGK